MKIWDELTLEQYAVMINAYEEGYLYDVMDEYGMRLQWAKTGEPRQGSDLDDEAKRRLISRFVDVVADMIERNWIEIRETHSADWDDAPSMTPGQIRAALTDPASWLRHRDGRHRMVMLLTTDHWDRLADRFPSQPEQS